MREGLWTCKTFDSNTFFLLLASVSWKFGVISYSMFVFQTGPISRDFTGLYKGLDVSIERTLADHSAFHKRVMSRACDSVYNHGASTEIHRQL